MKGFIITILIIGIVGALFISFNNTGNDIYFFSPSSYFQSLNTENTIVEGGYYLVRVKRDLGGLASVYIIYNNSMIFSQRVYQLGIISSTNPPDFYVFGERYYAKQVAEYISDPNNIPDELRDYNLTDWVVSIPSIEVDNDDYPDIEPMLNKWKSIGGIDFIVDFASALSSTGAYVLDYVTYTVNLGYKLMPWNNITRYDGDYLPNLWEEAETRYNEMMGE